MTKRRTLDPAAIAKPVPSPRPPKPVPELGKPARDQAIDLLMGHEYWPLIPKAFDVLRDLEQLKQKLKDRAVSKEEIKNYEAAVTNSDLEAVVALTASAPLRRYIFAKQLRSAGGQQGSGHGQEIHFGAQQALMFNGWLHELWPTLAHIEGMPAKYKKTIADEIIEALFKERLKQPLPANWRDYRPNKAVIHHIKISPEDQWEMEQSGQAS